jgi:hypothetical protein
MASVAPGAAPGKSNAWQSKTSEMWLRLGGSDGSPYDRRSPTPEKLQGLNRVRLLSLAIFGTCVGRMTLNAAWDDFNDISSSLAMGLGAAMCGFFGGLRMHQDGLVLFYLSCAMGMFACMLDIILAVVRLPQIEAAVIEISTNVTGLLQPGMTAAEVVAGGQVAKSAVLVSIGINAVLLLIELAGLVVGYALVRDQFPHPARPSQVAAHDGSGAADASKLEQGSAAGKGKDKGGSSSSSRSSMA